MEIYRKFVRNLATNKIDDIFINSDEDHALIVFVNLFQSSKKTIRIFASGLQSKVTENLEYIENLSDFIEKGGEVKILLNNFDKNTAIKSNLFSRLAFYKSIDKSITIKETNTKPHYKDDPEKKEIHFTIGDDCAYRLETDIIKKTATCNYNNSDIALKLSSFFDGIFEKEESKELDLLNLFKLS